jgi:hypothetical protein
VLWDNLFANDYDNGRRVYMGPYVGRDVSMCVEQQLVHAVLVNPNSEAPVNVVPIATTCAWAECAFGSAQAYDPGAACAAALDAWVQSGAWTTHSVPCTASGEPLIGSPPREGDIDPAAVPGDPILALEAARNAAQLATDLYFLPFELGPRATALIAAATRALRTFADDDVRRWEEASGAVQKAATHVTNLRDRALCHALYRFMWDLKEECLVISSVLEWGRRNFADVGAIPRATISAVLPDAPGCRTPFHVAGAIRGGPLQALRALTHFDPATAAFFPVQ